MLKIACLLQRSRRNNRGFTLVELLVVVAILGILAAIAVPRVVQNIQSARVGADIANELMILNALEAYFLEVTAGRPRLRFPATPTGTPPTFEADFIAFFGPIPAVPTGLGAAWRPYAERYTHTSTPTVPSGFTWATPNGLGPPGNPGIITRP